MHDFDPFVTFPPFFPTQPCLSMYSSTLMHMNNDLMNYIKLNKDPV